MRKSWWVLWAILTFAVCANAQNSQKSVPTEVFYEYNKHIPNQDVSTFINKQLGYSNQVKWVEINAITDELKQTHTRLAMYFNGVDVLKSRVIVHSDENGIFRLTGKAVPEEVLVLLSPTLSEEEALKRALDFYKSDAYYWNNPSLNEHLRTITGDSEASFFPKGKQVYVAPDFRNDTDQVLTWNFEIYSEKPLFGKSVYIDIQSGQLVAEQDLILHGNVTGTAETAYSGTRKIQTDSLSANTFRLRDYSRGKGIITLDMNTGTNYNASVDFTDSDNYWDNVNAQSDEVATDAHWGAEMTYDYFKSVHGRNSFDNQGAAIYSFVHYSQNYDNAFWNGYYMTYGDGNNFKPLTALDVCGHEIAHAVTTNTANLVYKNESGALNESFSDIFGQSVEAWSRPNQWDWKMGEDITNSGNGIRDMSNPNPYNDPQYYKGNKWYFGTGDNGGVHINSGVQNYWFYLLVDGVSGVNEKGISFDIDSLGYEKAAKIAYRNLSVYLTNSSTYTDARRYSILAAEDLFGPCSKEVQAVTNAWYVCGVGASFDSSFVKALFVGETYACSTSDTVNFQNLSNNYGSCVWEFGDGDTSHAFHPGHTYSGYGTFDVKLTVYSCDGTNSHSMVIPDYVEVDSTFDICSATLFPQSGSDTTYRCHGFIYDDGGEGDYGAMKTVSLTLLVPNADSIWYRIIYIGYEDGYDSLVMFHTDTTQKNKIAQFTGYTDPLAGVWNKVESDRLIFKQYSDPLVEGRGFKMEYQSYRPEFDVSFQDRSLSICYGDSVELKPIYSEIVDRDAYYRIPSPLDTVAPYWVNPKSRKSYVFGVSDRCMGTTQFDTIIVDVEDPLKINLNNDTTVCVGQAVPLTAIATGGKSGQYRYLWSNGLSDTSRHEVVFTDSAFVQLILSDACSIPDTTSISIGLRDSLRLNLDANNTSICPGERVQFKASSSGGLFTNYSYTWSPTSLDKDTASYVIDDTMWVSVHLTDGCTNYSLRDSVLVTVPKALSLSNLSDTSLCTGQGLFISAVATGGRASNYQIKWNDTLIKGFTDTIFPKPGYYTFRAILSDGCMPQNDTIRFSVLQRDTLKVTAGISKDVLCLGDSFSINYRVTGGDTSNWKVFWNSQGLNSSTGEISESPLSTGSWELNVTDACSPDTTVDFFVSVSPSRLTLNTLVFDSLICWNENNANIEIEYQKNNDPVSIEWIPNTYSGLNLQGLDSGQYKVMIADTFGCRDTLEFHIRKWDRHFKLSKDTLIHRGDTCFLWVDGTSSHIWDGPEIIDNPYDSKVRARPLRDTFYLIEGSDNHNCLESDTVFVKVITPRDYKIQNIITPNGDGKNDFWNLTPLGNLDEYQVYIFDRQGEIVYYTQSYKNNWNGVSQDGEQLSHGVYFYRLVHRYSNNALKGYIQLIR